MAFNVRGVCRQKLSGSNPASDQSSRSLSQSQHDPASEGLPFPLPPLPAWMREWLAPVRSSLKARPTLDRKSVVEGVRVTVRLDLGGRRILKPKKQDHQLH